MLVFLGGCKEQIVHNLDEVDANKIITTLHVGGIKADKKTQPDGRWAIAVEESESMLALKLLEEKRTLRIPVKASTIKGSMISSREAQKFEYERGLSQEIENTILTLEGILEARVHLNLPTPDPLLGKSGGNQNGTGSVLIVTRPNLDMNKTEIAKLVSGASGILSDNISVLVSSLIPEVSSPVAPTEPDQPISPISWQKVAILAGLVLASFLLVNYVLGAKRKFKKLQADFEAAR
jgi:type III secretion protein J